MISKISESLGRIKGLEDGTSVEVSSVETQVSQYTTIDRKISVIFRIKAQLTTLTLTLTLSVVKIY